MNRKKTKDTEAQNTIVAYLAEHLELVEVCASWAYSQRGCQSDGSLNRSIARFQEGADASRLNQVPITVVALAHGQPAGMASLWAADFSDRPELSPWLASVYVHPFFRGKGIAPSLVDRIEREAVRLGYREIYLVTEEARGLYEKCGWQVREPVRTDYGEASLMQKKL